MPSYIDERKTVEVPSNTGVAGYLKVIGEILELPRVQKVVLDIGSISYQRFRKDDEPERIVGQDLESLRPAAIIKNRTVTEIKAASDNAAIVVAQLFAQATMDGYNPVAFVSGLHTMFWSWHARSTGLMLNKKEAYGLSFYGDQMLPDEALILCVSYGRRAAMVDVVHSYKVTIPGGLK